MSFIAKDSRFGRESFFLFWLTNGTRLARKRRGPRKQLLREEREQGRSEIVLVCVISRNCLRGASVFFNKETDCMSHVSQKVAAKTISIGAALEVLKGESRCLVTSMAAAEPQMLYRHLHEVLPLRREKLRIYCANPGQLYPCFELDDLESRVEFVVMFLTECVRRKQGPLVQYFPQHLSHWFKAMKDFGPAIDIYWGSCSLPDERGFVTLGPGACYETEAFHAAKLRILEVNPHIPATNGSTLVSIDSVTYFVPSEAPLPCLQRPKLDETDHKIASYVADLVANGSTLQLGIGSIPNAIGLALESKRDLGIHTEMMNDTMMDLYDKGVVTGACKTRWPRKMVAAFAYGTQDLYRFIDRNPAVELHPASVVNDPYRIGLNHKMVSINSAVEVDITGQVCSESVGHRELSGVGGATDTHIGAQRSEGGRGLIVIKSATKDLSTSKIVFELKPGAKVSISRNDIDTIITEHGVAQLKGKTVSERARAMIGIAHPQFRDQLLHQARQAAYL
jgi:acyl-CoA hydrolase